MTDNTNIPAENIVDSQIVPVENAFGEIEITNFDNNLANIYKAVAEKIETENVEFPQQTIKTLSDYELEKSQTMFLAVVEGCARVIRKLKKNILSDASMAELADRIRTMEATNVAKKMEYSQKITDINTKKQELISDEVNKYPALVLSIKAIETAADAEIKELENELAKQDWISAAIAGAIENMKSIVRVIGESIEGKFVTVTWKKPAERVNTDAVKAEAKLNKEFKAKYISVDAEAGAAWTPKKEK